MSLPLSKAACLIILEQEERARREHRSRAELGNTIKQAQAGNVRPYVNLQWPGVHLEEWQWDILESLFDPSIKRVFVKGNTGCGKGAAAGIGICMYYHIWDDAKIVITRDSAQSAIKTAWGEVDKWWRSMMYKPPGTLLTAGAYESKQHNISVANPRQVEGFRGSHSPHVLFWFDEATAGNLVDKYPLANTQAKKLLALSNPSTLSGPFRDAFPKVEPDRTQTIIGLQGKTRCITVSGWDCTNVQQKCLENPIAPVNGIEINGHQYEHGDEISPEDFEASQPIVPGQTCYDEFVALLNDPDPLIRNVYALGKFPDEDPEKQIILPSWLVKPQELHSHLEKIFQEHQEIYNQLFPISGFGLDVAASLRGDASVLAAGGGYGVRGIHEYRFKDTQDTVNWVLTTAEEIYGVDLTQGRVPIGIDWGGGYGNAVGDPLRRMGVDVVEIKGNATSDIDPKKYGNKRAELYGETGRRLDPSGDFTMMTTIIPNNPRLESELTAPQKIYFGHNGEKYYITPKGRRGSDDNFKGQTIKEMLGRSPDRADAVVYCLCAMRDGGRPQLMVA